MNNTISDLKNILSKARAVLITAGAGIGVDSGLPDFRGKEGFWRAYPYAKKLGLSFEDLANPVWFRTDPELAWAFYGHRLNLYRETRPHKGFYLLRDFVKSKDDNYFIFTSNVDGQFQKAGFDENKIVEIHGTIHHFQCNLPCSDDIWEADGIKVNIDMERFRAISPLPKCKNCGNVARPNILMFNDFSWISDRTSDQKIKLDKWLKQNKGVYMVIIEIGAGKSVPTVRLFSERVAREYGATLIRINPIDYDIPTSVNKGISIPLGGLKALEMILK